MKPLREHAPYIYDAGASGHNIASRSPYGGLTLPWRITATFVHGVRVFADGEVLAAPAPGDFTARLTWTGAA